MKMMKRTLLMAAAVLALAACWTMTAPTALSW